MDGIQHFLHEHPLSYLENFPENIGVNWCNICRKDCDGDLFFCLSCWDKNVDFRLHKCCAEQPQEITHPHHSPNHELKMIAADDNATKDCAWCGNHVSPGMFYACAVCEFYLHQACNFDVPDKILQYFHQHHPLQIRFDKNMPWNKTCIVCGYMLRSSLSFICESHATIGIHGRCTGLSPDLKFENHENTTILNLDMVDHIQHFSHEDPLFYHKRLSENTNVSYCGLCGRNCDDDLF